MIKRMITLTAMMLALVMLLSGCSLFAVADDRPVCNLNEYVVISESGINGKGELYIDVDYETIMKDFGKYVEYEAIDEIPEWLEYGIGDGDAVVAINALFYGVELNDILRTRTFNLVPSQTKCLNNGDVVQVKWTDSPVKREVLEKLLPLNFVYEDFTYTISKLPTE